MTEVELAMPAGDVLDKALREAVEIGRAVAGQGAPARYIPQLARIDPSLVAVAVQTPGGVSAKAGDADAMFTLQSVSKVFALASVLQRDGRAVFEKVSMEPSGDAFHSIDRLETEQGRPRNPLINAGAIVISERLPGRGAEDKILGFRRFLTDLCELDSQEFALDTDVYRSEARTGHRNRALAYYMAHFGVVQDPETAVDAYFRQCSLTCDVATLARAGLFLANDGRHPATANRILSPELNRTVLALMTTCGLYDEVGRFAVRVGVPAKSGVSGAMLAIVPGHLSIACYGPALGAKGNSLAGMHMLEYLVGRIAPSVFSPT